MSEWVVGVIVGCLATVIGGSLLHNIVKAKQRSALLRTLRVELGHFRGRLFLEPLAEREYPIVSTINVLLLQQVLLSDVLDYRFDSELVALITELIEEINRFNNIVRVVNGFTYGAGFNTHSEPAFNHARGVLYEHLIGDLDGISHLVEQAIGKLEIILTAPGE